MIYSKDELYIYIYIYIKIILKIQKEIHNINEAGKNYPTLTKAEGEALQNLMYDKNISIKPADIGSTIVIWDKKDHLKECELQLGNKSVYELKRDLLQGIMQKIPNTLLDML